MTKSFTLYRADCRQKETNTTYPHKEIIAGLPDLLRTARNDHIFSEMKDDHRAEDNYISTDGIVLDLDNTFSHDPDDWKTIDDVAEALPDVMFYYVESRNHMKPKSKTNKKGVTTYEEARPKYHLYFPLSKRITDHEEIAKLLLEAAGLYCYLDLGSAEPQHLFFGVAKAQGGEMEGTITIDEYIAACGDDLPEIIARNLDDYEQNVKAGRYNKNAETEKAISRLNTYIGRESMPDDDQQDDYNIADPVAWIDDAERDNQIKWLEAWADDNHVELGKRHRIHTKKHPHAVTISVTCPWEDEHSMNGAENESVIIIDAGGQLHYLCRHSHGSNLSWKDYRKKVEEEANKHIQMGLKTYIEQKKEEAQEDKKAAYLQTSAASHIQGFLGEINASINTPAISTGYTDLDAILDGGLYEGLYVLGGISSLGKTTLLLNIADNMAKNEQDVLIFSLEMARSELMAKSISRLTFEAVQATDGDTHNAKTARGITTGARYANYSQTEKDLIKQAVNTYGGFASHIFIHEGIGNIGVERVKEVINEHISITGNKPVVIIDYLQVLAPYDIRGTDKQNTDKAILELRRISRDYKLPVIAISSFNRESYKTNGGINQGRVSMTDFKESGAVEYSADVLIGLEFETAGTKDYDEKEEKKQDPRHIRLVVLKQRNGEPYVSTKFDYYAMFNCFQEIGGLDDKDDATTAEDIFKDLRKKPA